MSNWAAKLVETLDDGTLVLECVSCRGDFRFTVSEQAFFENRNFTRPKRCQACRAAKRAQFEAAGDQG